MLQCLEVLCKERSSIRDILDLGAATGVKSVGQDAILGVKSVG